jgi:hypothetical protein
MGQPRQVEVCMAPSIELTRFDASTMGGIVEQAILRDYVDECARNPRKPFDDREEFWDTSNREHWKLALITRHPHISGRMLDDLIKLKRLKVPDISSWRALYLRRGVLDPAYPGDRNELYEVKPDSAWGIVAAAEKLVGIMDNFRKLRLDGYKFGSWYPEPPGPKQLANKTIYFVHQPHVAESFRYRLKRIERSLANLGLYVQILDTTLDVERRTPGILYYKICVKMRLDFQGEDAVAKRVVRLLYEAMTSSAVPEVRERELRIAASYERIKGHPLPAPPSDTASRRLEAALRLEEMFRVQSLGVVPELEGELQALANTLFSKLRGLPGDRFMICGDENFVNDEILRPRELQKQRMLQRFQVRPPIGGFGQPLAVAAAINQGVIIGVTGCYILEKTFFSYMGVTYDRWPQYAAIIRWLELHPAESLIIGGVVVYGTALLAAGAIATGGALFAAPAGASVLAPAGAAAPTGLAAPTGAALASGGVADVGLGLARGVGGELMSDAALPVIEETLPQMSMRVTPEAIRAIARQELQALLRQRLDQAATQEAEKAASTAALRAIRAERLEKAVQSAGPFLGALVLHFLTPTNPGLLGSAAQLDAASDSIGTLYLLQLRPGVDSRSLPYCKPFDYARYSPDVPGDPPRPNEKLCYLGLIECL